MAIPPFFTPFKLKLKCSDPKLPNDVVLTIVVISLSEFWNSDQL